MGKKSDLLIKESVLELKNIVKRQKSLRSLKRINCLLFIKKSKFETRQKLADYLGVYLRTQSQRTR